jgi:hypothetical protein
MTDTGVTFPERKRIENWAECMEQEEKELKMERKSRKKLLREQTFLAKKQSEKGREIFVGGFPDESELLENKNIKMKRRFQLRDKRRELFLSIFSQFGEVETTR